MFHATLFCPPISFTAFAYHWIMFFTASAIFVYNFVLVTFILYIFFSQIIVTDCSSNMYKVLQSFMNVIILSAWGADTVCNCVYNVLVFICLMKIRINGIIYCMMSLWLLYQISWKAIMHHGIHTLIKYRRQVHSRLSLWFYFRFFFTFFRNDFFYDHCQTN